MSMLWDDDIIEKKQCSDCGEHKPLHEFPKHIGHYDNLDSRCRSCIKFRANERKLAERSAPRPKPNPRVCECCKKPLEHGNGRRKVDLACDHDRKTGAFRGWLCNRCNVGIGLLGDDEEGILTALEYLRNAKETDNSVFDDD